LTFAIVGGGPTGVELAGAIKEIAGQTLQDDYKHIDTRTTRVILFEGINRLLAQFPLELSVRAQQDLERMGVEVRLNSLVTKITPQGINLGDEFISLHNVFWAAGVQASSLGRSLGTALDRAGRVIVGHDLTIPGHPEVFVVGDLASAKSADTGEFVPAVAQGAIQMGRYAGRTIAAEVTKPCDPKDRVPFGYRDKGTMAVIGKAKAVAVIGKWKWTGFFAWLLWGGVHISFLIDFRSRWRVLLSWFWGWVLNVRDARLITGNVHLDSMASPPPGFVPDTPAGEKNVAG
jgi:NADH:ubiquinone reductase (H+-translocating)